MRVKIQKGELVLKMLIKIIALYCNFILTLRLKKDLKSSSAEITKKGKKKLIRFTKGLASFQFAPFKTPF